MSTVGELLSSPRASIQPLSWGAGKKGFVSSFSCGCGCLIEGDKPIMIAAAVLSPGQKETLQGQGPPWHKRKYSCESSTEEAGSSPQTS